jgi:hypothetical protein
MEAGFRAAFVIAWRQVTVDGIAAPPLDTVAAGAVWSWQGDAQAVMNPGAPLLLTRRTTGPRARDRLAGAGLSGSRVPTFAETAPPPPDHIVLTDGRTDHVAMFLRAPAEGWLLQFDRQPPPPGQALWVVSAHVPAVVCAHSDDHPRGLVAGTRVATARGNIDVALLRRGDLLLTLDRGPQPVLSITRGRFGGARLYADPALRPVRFRTPQGDALIAPGQRVVLGGPATMDLYGMPAMVAAADDLIDDDLVLRDCRLRAVDYVTPHLPVPALILADGLTVAVSPAGANDQDLAAALPPGVGAATTAEVALLRHGGARPVVDSGLRPV